MKELQRLIPTAAVLSGVGLLMSMMGADPVVAQHPKPVEIVNGPIAQVGNTASQPVPVRDVEYHGRQFFREAVNCTAFPGDFFSQVRFLVPADKLLVIKTVSVGANVPSGRRAATSCVVESFPPSFAYTVSLQHLQSFSTTDSFGALEQVRLYAGPGEQVRLVFFRDQVANSAIGSMTVSGYLVDCGPGPGCPIP